MLMLTAKHSYSITQHPLMSLHSYRNKHSTCLRAKLCNSTSCVDGYKTLVKPTYGDRQRMPHLPAHFVKAGLVTPEYQPHNGMLPPNYRLLTAVTSAVVREVEHT